MENSKITECLFSLKDEKYASFQKKLIPSVKPESIIGVRTPELRNLAREIYVSSGAEVFLSSLPHESFEENQLHAFLISLDKNYESVICQIEKFLPYVDNWATCDQMNPKCLAKNKSLLIEKISCWIKSSETYTVRFGIKCMMQYFLNDDFKVEYAEMISVIKSDEYYVNMMISWYFATALAKQWNLIFPFISEKKLDEWNLKKTVQKACESYRITDERKKMLRDELKK